MYLEIFLADFVVFRVFWGISRKYLNFAGPRPREISEALNKGHAMYAWMEPCIIFFLWPTLILPKFDGNCVQTSYLLDYKRCLINFYNLQRSIYLWYHLFSVKFLKYLTTVMVNNLLILCIQTEIHLHVKQLNSRL